jgi:hypothetical protein
LEEPWKDKFIKNMMRHPNGIDPKYFPAARGLGLEDLVADLVDWHLKSNTDLEEALGLPCARCEILFLDYEGKTDADLLLIEINEEKEKPRVFIFNIKTHPNLLLSNDTFTKFQDLCKLFKDYDVSLVLMVADLCGEDPRVLLAKWKDVEGCTPPQKIYSLKDFVEIAPTILVKKNGVLSVDRPLEKNEIKKKIATTFLDVVVQGRFRVGKSHLLIEMAAENSGWIYTELL